MYDCTLLCVYDLAKISGQMMMDILTTHPYVVHRRRVDSSLHQLRAVRKRHAITGGGRRRRRPRGLQQRGGVELSRRALGISGLERAANKTNKTSKKHQIGRSQ